MKLIKLKCEGCGAILKVNENLKKISCNYCGTEFIVDDDSTTHTYIKIDQAKIKEAEIKDKINERKLKYKEREEIRTIIVIFLLFTFAILLINLI